MIKPDVMDGVPEEEGYYFVNYTLGAYDFWICGPIEKDKAGNLYFFYQNGGVDIGINEDEFVNYNWSERIAEPTTDH